MTDREIQEVLDELNLVRPEVLNDKAKKLFDAIMKIADERDELKKIEEAHHELNGELRKELQLKDRMIDEMIEVIATVTVPQEKCKQCIKEYFTKKASEENE